MARAPLRARLRWVGPSELPTLVRHRRLMWEDIGGRTVRQLNWADVAYRAWLRRELSAHRWVGVVVELPGGEVVASGGIWLQPAQPRPAWPGLSDLPYLMSMYTEPAYRHRGVATRIVRALVGWARARGYPRVFLHASRFGRPVYRKLGFVPGSEMRIDLGRRRGAGTRRR